MTDYGTQITNKSIAKLDKKIQSIYSEAADEIQVKMDDFLKKYKVKEAIKSEQLKKGEITKEQYDNWVKGQVFQSEQWKAKKKEILSVLTNSNKIAVQMINAESLHVFSENANYESYKLDLAGKIDFGFSLYNSDAVSRLIKKDPKVLPEWKVNEPKDYVWNSKKVNRQVTQGIIQGESLDKISKRLSSNLSSQDKNHMKTFARTAMTGAQNAGVNESLKQAKMLGINVMKMWMATLDGRTRDSHRHLDGEKIPVGDEFKFSNGLEYPGDPDGPAHEVFNCRCTLVGDIEGFDTEYERFDNANRYPIKNMTYREWKDARSVISHKSAEDFVWNKEYNGVANRNYGKADTSDALQEVFSGKHNSLENYMDENGNLSLERIALHKQIIDNYLIDKIPEEGIATMVMMGGGPASGKSSVLKAGLYQLPNQSIIVDPDDIKRYLPNYNRLSKISDKTASFYHEESSMIAKQLASVCFSENYNVVYDGTGNGSVGSVMKKINGAKEHGYQVNAMYVTINTDEALIRNKQRYDDAVSKGESPRRVPDSYVISCHKKVTQISMETSDQFDSISLYDNNGEEGSIKLIAKGGNGKKLTPIKGEEEAFESFLDKAK